MKKIIYYIAIAAGIFVAVRANYLASGEITLLNKMWDDILSLFLLIFGAYGLKAESLIKKFTAEGKMERFCIEVNYYAQQKGLLGRVLLFPFMKVKSKNSLFISFLGAITWIIIILIAFQTYVKIAGK